VSTVSGCHCIMIRPNLTRQVGFWVFLISVVSLGFHLRAADVSVFAVYKRQVYIQTSTEPPVLRCCPYVFDAVVQLTDSNSVTAAAIGVNSLLKPLAHSYLEEFLPKRWIAWDCSSFADQKSLDEAWPNGEYTFSIFGANDGAKTSTLALRGDAYPPKPPYILNFVEAQNVDPSKDFTVRWEGFPEGTTNDSSFVLIKRERDGKPVTNTPFLAEPGCLDGTVKEIVIAAGTLERGEDYDVYVRYDRVIMRDATSYAGAIGQASYGNGTHFKLRTTVD
jgi:hypothetical protein